MSTIYSAGQYDDAFTPKRLGNWESTPKESYPFRKALKLHSPKIIVDSRGHLLPWVSRGDRTSSWGLLNLHLRNKYNGARGMFVMSGRGKQISTTTKGDDGGCNETSLPSSSIKKRFRRLPKFVPRKMDNSPPPDLLLEYLQHLCLPIVWIIGPSTRNIFQKRKQFSKQLATSLGFGYVNLDEKIQEWKERQQVCTCGGGGNGSSSSLAMMSNDGVLSQSQPHGPLHSLAQTSIAPSKLPTNVPPFISPNIPSPPSESYSGGGTGDASEYILSILESQQIAFDTALPIERSKILELYKFAMAECLPCDGFIMDSVPFDLVEGLQFEKIFYTVALAIYFTEGVPQRKQKMKPKDQRVTANTVTSIHSARKITLMSPLDYLERSRKHKENVYLKTKSHKRLGVFNLAEGEKICKQFGSKTIRIINAEDVERDTMEFLNELVKRNLVNYQDILEGKFKLDFGVNGGDRFFPGSNSTDAAVSAPPSSTYSSPFILKKDEESLFQLEEIEELARHRGGGDGDDGVLPKTNMPPALITAHQSETSLFTLPNIFNTSGSCSSMASSVSASPRPRNEKLEHTGEEFAASAVKVLEAKDDYKNPQMWNAVEQQEDDQFNTRRTPPLLPEELCFPVVGAKENIENNISSSGSGAGDRSDHHSCRNAVSQTAAAAFTVEDGRKSAQVWERIVKLESKVAQLKTPEEYHQLQLKDFNECANDEWERHEDEDVLPPPTAYSEEDHYPHQEDFDEDDDVKFTEAIRNAIGSKFVTAQHQWQQNGHDEYTSTPPPQNYHSSGQLLPVDYGASGDCCGSGGNIQHLCASNTPLAQQLNGATTTTLPFDKQNRQKMTNLEYSSSNNNNNNNDYQQDSFYDD